MQGSVGATSANAGRDLGLTTLKRAVLNQSPHSTKPIRNLIKWGALVVILFLIIVTVFVYLRIRTGYFPVGPSECSNPDRDSIHGTVADLTTGDPIANVDVAIEGEGYVIYCSNQYTGTIEHHLKTDDEGRFSVRLLYWPSTPLQFAVNAPDCEQYVALKSLRDMERLSYRDYAIQISLNCEQRDSEFENPAAPVSNW